MSLFICKWDYNNHNILFVFRFSGESRGHFHGHLHCRMLSEDHCVWARIPRGGLFTELLEHIGLRHRVHGVRWALGRTSPALLTQPEAIGHLLVTSVARFCKRNEQLQLTKQAAPWWIQTHHLCVGGQGCKIKLKYDTFLKHFNNLLWDCHKLWLQ